MVLWELQKDIKFLLKRGNIFYAFDLVLLVVAPRIFILV